MKAAPSTLVWHMRTKVPERIRALEAHAARSRCELRFEQLACRTYTACTGARWRACEPAPSRRAMDNCSSALGDLLHRAHDRTTQRRTWKPEEQ